MCVNIIVIFTKNKCFLSQKKVKKSASESPAVVCKHTSFFKKLIKSKFHTTYKSL